MSILSWNVISPKEEVKTHPCVRGHGTVNQSPYRQGSFQILHGTKSLAGDNQGLSGWHPVLSETVGVGAGGSQKQTSLDLQMVIQPSTMHLG